MSASSNSKHSCCSYPSVAVGRRLHILKSRCERFPVTVFQLSSPDAIYNQDTEKKRNQAAVRSCSV
jgi:hypothetical protein